MTPRGDDRARPWHHSYVVQRVLAAQIRGEADRRLRGRSGLELIDVGCGDRPYESIFAPYTNTHLGVDASPRSSVDLVASAESLPVESESFDVVLCTQTLEHVPEPWSTVRELHRVLRPGGLLFLSTHGTARYHPNPGDYWRWTCAGLELLLTQAADWAEITVRPNAGIPTAITYLMTGELEGLAWSRGLRALTGPPVFVLNVLSWSMDRRLNAHYSARGPGLAVNYLAVAVR